MKKPRLICVVLSFISIASYPLSAATITYTNESAFLTALPGAASTLDFDSTTASTLINSGSSLGGITFTYSIGPPPIKMMVTDDFLTTSGNNYLGLDDAGNYNLFIAGDVFSMTFANPVNALGMYFVSGDPLFAGDISLVTSAGNASNSATIDVTLTDGGLAYYIGLISDQAFSSASIQFDAGAVETFLYSVDDITTTAVPLPTTFWLFGSGLLGLMASSRKINTGDRQ